MNGNSIKNAGIGVEAGGWSNPRFSVALAGYILNAPAQGNQFLAAAYSNLTFDNTEEAFLEFPSAISTKDGFVRHTGASLIASSGGTTQYPFTLHTDQLNSFGQISQGVQSKGSGDTFSIDWNLGGIAEMTLTGNSTCSFSNVRNGATYMVYITTTGTQTITPSASGYTFKYEGGGFTLTTNGTDLCVLDVVGTNIYVRHFADFS